MAIGQRFLLLDLARTLALAGMVVFHLTWDLSLFGLFEPSTPVSGVFWYLARVVAGSFLFLAGMGLWLSHGAGIRWRAFGRRLGKIAVAALLVSVVTWFAMPEVWIFYGILHSIAVSSLLGLLVLRLPAGLILALAALVLVAPIYGRDPLFDGWLVWTGLSTQMPYTADFEPLFPWFAPFLAGVAGAKLFDRFSLWSRIEPAPSALLRRLAWPGRHSLAIYLIHQPLLLGLVFSLAWLTSG